MRKFLSVIAAGGMLLAVSVAGMGAANASHGASAVHRGHAVVQKASPDANPILYNQNNDMNPFAIVSQNFEASMDAEDAQSADDFVVPAATQWQVTEVDVTGLYFNGPGPADSENVIFYRDAAGLPGAVVKAVPNVVGQGTPTGSFRIPVGKVNLNPGHYWVSVQANMNFTPNGEWGWQSKNTAVGTAAAWQNPGGGFGVGCTTWTNMQTCIGPQGEGADFMFALRGRSRPQP